MYFFKVKSHTPQTRFLPIKQIALNKLLNQNLVFIIISYIYFNVQLEATKLLSSLPLRCCMIATICENKNKIYQNILGYTAPEIRFPIRHMWPFVVTRHVLSKPLPALPYLWHAIRPNEWQLGLVRARTYGWLISSRFTFYYIVWMCIDANNYGHTLKCILCNVFILYRNLHRVWGNCLFNNLSRLTTTKIANQYNWFIVGWNQSLEWSFSNHNSLN